MREDERKLKENECNSKNERANKLLKLSKFSLLSPVRIGVVVVLRVSGTHENSQETCFSFIFSNTFYAYFFFLGSLYKKGLHSFTLGAGSFPFVSPFPTATLSLSLNEFNYCGISLLKRTNIESLIMVSGIDHHRRHHHHHPHLCHRRHLSQPTKKTFFLSFLS